MKLLTRYSLINLLVMVVIFFVSSCTLYFFIKVILLREIDGDLGGIEDKIKEYVNTYHTLPNLYALDEEQINFYPTGEQKATKEFETVRLYSKREKKLHNFRKMAFPLQFNNSWYRVTVAKPLEGMRHLSHTLLTISVLTILITILIAIVINRFMLKRLWKPFYQSLDVMRNFKLGKTGTPVFPETTINEFAFMNESLLMATEKAEQDYLLLREFTENASHEIQTPLSIIRSKLEMIIQEEDLSQKQSELARSAFTAVKKLTRLNQSLLLLAKIENHQFDTAQVINLKTKIDEKLEQFSELWESQQIKAAWELEEATVFINPELLDILLNNLLSNASNHNIPFGHIFIKLEGTQLVISNTGYAGALDQKRLFSRFYKQSLNSNHNGLGLSIVKQISRVSLININYLFANGLHSFVLNW
ncbi:MAG: sensor histidine kinase [Niastella sp.]|uniref:sensor histidine kinase n=1 Tax=Niastella sp. TaxID=1869183 RepID=UPI00389A7BB0